MTLFPTIRRTSPNLYGINPKSILFPRETWEFNGVSKYKKWIERADAPMSASTYIELKGIAEEDDVELGNVSISLESTPGRLFPFPSTTITDNVKVSIRINAEFFFN